MSVNSSFTAQDPNHPVAGGYIQPATGTTGQLVCITDTAGSAMKSVGTASNVAYMGIAQYRDSTITAQGSGTQTAPTAATVIATVTPGTAGLWEVTFTISISGTSVVATESNNMGLYQTAAAKINPIPSVATTAGFVPLTFGGVILNLGASDTVNIKAIGNATATTPIYAAMIVCRLVG
jgi:hypothetical protein